MKLFTFLILISFALNTSAETLYNYKVVKVVDGDTVNVKVDFLPKELGDTISIRIHGIDTPELRGKCIKEIESAKKAKTFLKELLNKNEYSIVIKGRDKYFRLLGDIKIKEDYVSDILLNNGHAVSYKGKLHKQSWC